MRQNFRRAGGPRWITSIAGAVLAAGLLVGAAGCSGDSDTSASEPTTAAASAAPVSSTPVSNTGWNPCSIPDADLSAAGLNPDKRFADTDKSGQKFPGWDICGWDSNSWYGIDVYSTNAHTFDEVIHNTNNYENPRPISIAGRHATMLDPLSIPDGCTIVFSTVAGPIQFELNPKLSADAVGDSCVEITRIADVLVKDLPAEK